MSTIQAPAIDADELVALAGDTIRIPSVSGDEERLAIFLRDWFAEHGIAADLQYAAPGRPNVIARLPGSGGGRSLMLNGHIDMTAVLPDYEGDPWEPLVEAGELRGAGISNMKGAVAAMCAALAALRRGPQLAGDVVLTAVVGECDLLGLGTKAMLESGLRTDAAICAEPTLLQIQLAHTGVYQFNVTVHGASAHVQEREQGDNAVYRAMQLLPFLDEESLTYVEHPILGHPPLTIGEIRGGVLPSVTAPSCVLTGDIRLVPGMTRESVTHDLETMIAAARALHPGLRADVESFVFSPPFSQEHAAPLFDLLGEAHAEVLGEPVAFRARRDVMVTDCSHLGAAGIPTALYGPGAFTMTDRFDHLAVADMAAAARVYAATAARFCR
jgi:acetylornithine deacetylase